MYGGNCGHGGVEPRQGHWEKKFLAEPPDAQSFFSKKRPLSLCLFFSFRFPPTVYPQMTHIYAHQGWQLEKSWMPNQLRHEGRGPAGA
jgi:hypothetical protein